MVPITRQEYVHFCEEASGTLHQFSTLQSDSNVWNMALDLKDTSLLAKLEGGDTIALEAKYHLNCLTKFRNHHRSHIRESQNDFNKSHEWKRKEARAFVEILEQILAHFTEAQAQSDGNT